jgi:hypothetical protein
MNERIRELAEQCESFGSWDNKTYSFDKEKFAELIVRECIKAYNDDGYQTEHKQDQRVLKHFGVKS